MNRIALVSEAGEPTIEPSEAERIRDDLLSSGGTDAFRGRAHSAATAIQRAIKGDGRVVLEGVEQLGVIEVLDARDSLDPELVALRAALVQAPSLTHTFGRDS
jgi:hypothetical protein